METPTDLYQVRTIMETLAGTWQNTLEAVIEDCEQPWWDACLNTEENTGIGFEDGMERYFGRELDRAKDLAELGLIEYLCERQGIAIPLEMKAKMQEREEKIERDLQTYPDGYKFSPGSDD
jgi:hypothetical protein